MSRDNISDAYTTKDGRLHAKEALEKVTSQFLDRLHSDENQYDAATTWIDVSIVKSREVNRLRIDNAEWGDYIPEIEPDSDDEDEHDWDNPSSHKLPLRSVHHAGAPISGGDAAKSKLRPAVDVLSRLRWDPDMSPSDYIVGYEDRFSGAKEISLERWKSESTDDEFVPLHRILYFKKRVDNEIVWDRRTRVDKVFGSGCGGGE